MGNGVATFVKNRITHRVVEIEVLYEWNKCYTCPYTSSLTTIQGPEQSFQFLTELTRLFQKCRTSGSIYLTMKKYDGRTKPVPRKGNPDNFEPADNKCLLRATDGKKKISTVISSKEVNKFQMAYSNLLRAHMDGLKKKDKKSKSKKTKATQ
ncbi:signal recognition particle 14 kDa protein isoform X2 [Hypanus sabinus]|uniref:signal recognition particle 14 kDa protein isoform X2 n=1 Tax=Hypanus sabinus TaxID=79690 RepID=UPI0028C3CB14|nr:signal recognition particle 14 kDa protein isoform X2 [Hypanus sabinus]